MNHTCPATYDMVDGKEHEYIVKPKVRIQNKYLILKSKDLDFG